MAAVESPVKGFPDTLECVAHDSVLRGQYKLMNSGSKASLKFVTSPDSEMLYVYERVGGRGVYLVYCEGVPELLPGDIWQTVIADALSRHAAANMSAAVSGHMSDTLCAELCEEIKNVATEVSKELVGWLIVSSGSSHMVPLARCIQRLPEDQLFTPRGSARPRSVQIADATWEVREATGSKAFTPEWLLRGLSPSWTTLVIQPGEFKKDISFRVRPVEPTPMLTKPVPLPALRRGPSAPLRMPTVYESPRTRANSSPRVGAETITSCGLVEHTGPTRYVWNLIGCQSSLERCAVDARGIESLPFADVHGELFIIVLQPITSHGMLSVSLSRSLKESGRPVKFKLSIGSGQSGVKCLVADSREFEVVLDPRAVFGSPTVPSVPIRVSLLKNLSVTVDFV